MTDEKTTNRLYWEERALKPCAVRPMSKDDIESFRVHLVSSYKCGPEDIQTTFKRIVDINDEDRNDCLMLIYTLNVISPNGLIEKRPIFNLKVPIPDEIRTKVNARKAATKTTMKRSRPAIMAPGPIIEEVTNETTPAPIPTIVVAPTPVLKKPVKKPR